MAALENALSFVTATVLLVVAWLVYLWLNNLVSRMRGSPLQEVAGGLLSFALFVAIGAVLYFLAVPLAMGVITISVLLMLSYVVRKSLPSKSA